MGRVYRAHDGRLQRDVALKVMAEHYAQTPEFVERFRREIRNVASLDHPNVIRVFDSGEAEDGSPYMAMELASGGTLKDRIRSTGPLPPREAARVALQVAEALDVAHAAGIVHRDVKPENVLLTETGDVKVGDFGIARATEATAMTNTSMILGTAPYLSPEQARGEPVGPSSDLYSLGVVLYESLTGRTPFGTGEHLNPLAIAMKHCNELAPSPRAANRGVPEALELITLTLMRKRPEERHPDAAALAADLAAFLENRRLPSAAALRVASSPEGARTNVLRHAPATPPRRRRRKVLPLTAIALATVLALLASSPAQLQRPVAFVEHTIVPDAEALDRAVRPVLDGPPDVPRVPEENKAEASGGKDPEADPEPRPDAGAAFSKAPAPEAPADIQTGSASASASASPSASASATPEASAAPATEEAPPQAPTAPSAPASPAPTGDPGSVPAQPAPQTPDASAPAEGPDEGPPAADDLPAGVRMPEIDIPDF